MKLKDLVKQCENDEEVMFQVNQSGYDDWDEIDEVHSYSPFLVPFLEREICSLTAIEKDVFRFTIKAEVHG